MTHDLLDVAEAPAAHVQPRPKHVVVTDRYVVTSLGPVLGVVQRIRLAPDEVASAVEEVRQIGRERGWSQIAWWVGERSTPPDLAERLGFASEDTLAAMALTSPPAGEPVAELRRVENADDFRRAQEIDLIGMGCPEEELAARLEQSRAAWEWMRETFLLWLAYIDGEPVGMARAARADTALLLVGVATLPHARGRGVYTSLVHARWREAVARGTPALVVQAGEMSRPILERLGFEHLGEIRQLVDRVHSR